MHEGQQQWVKELEKEALLAAVITAGLVFLMNPEGL